MTSTHKNDSISENATPAETSAEPSSTIPAPRSPGFWEKFLEKKLYGSKFNLWKLFYLLRKIYFTIYFRTYFSQFGEDIVLKGFIMKSIRDGFYVDVGCYHPKKYSNTYKLYRKGWRGINIDLDALKIDAFNMVRGGDCNIVAAISDKPKTIKHYSFGFYSLVSTIDEKTALKNREGIQRVKEIKTRTLDEVISSTRYAGRRIDLLSVDAEGHDLEVLQSLDFEKYQPRLIVVETHLTNMDLILESELHRFLVNKNYKMVNWVGFTLFYALPDNGLTLPHIP